MCIFDKNSKDDVSGNNKQKIIWAILLFILSLGVSILLAECLMKLIISPDDSETITKLLVFAIVLMIIPFCLGLACVYLNVDSSKEILKDATMGLCYVFGAGIIISIIPIITQKSIRDGEKQDYRPEVIINETISNYERKLIIEETEKGLIEKNYKSKFINNDMKTVKDIRSQIRRDVVNKIDKEK